MPKIREMFRGSMGKFSFVLGLTSIVVLYFLVFLVGWQAIFLPDPYYVELPEFKGRVLSGEKVKPGTFTIKEDFESISQWGDNGLLSYKGATLPLLRHELHLTAWRPDPKTTGVFQYAQKKISMPEYWGAHHSIGNIEREGNLLKVNPRASKQFWGRTIFGSILGVILFILALAANPAISKWIDEKEVS